MIDVLPKKLLKKSETKKLASYPCDFQNKIFIKKYLKDIFGKWIESESIKNPMTIFWVRQLYKRRLDKLEKNLENLQRKLGENNLRGIFNELENESGDEISVVRKIESLKGEITAFKELVNNGYDNLGKINQVGDWENDNSIISVKSILDLDFNYQLLGEIITGMFFAEENSILRKYNKINFKNGKNVDYKFQKNIVDFLADSFLSALNFTDKELGYSDKVEIKTTKYFCERNIQTGYIEIFVNGYVENASKKIIEFNFREDRAGEEKFKHRFTMKMETYKENSGIFSINYETDAYWEGNALDWSVLEGRIKKHIDEFDKNLNKQKKQKNFIGWINISVHPKHEYYIKGNKEKVSEILKTVKCDRNYKIYFCFNPQVSFDLTTAIIIET